jgi:hypothetical protein
MIIFNRKVENFIMIIFNQKVEHFILLNFLFAVIIIFLHKLSNIFEKKELRRLTQVFQKRLNQA